MVTLVIAHRGASTDHRENTIAAFERAVELGADGIELDVRRSADDRLIVHHDPVLPDGRHIRSTRSSDLPHDVIELDTALDACSGAFVNIEIKNIPGEPDFDSSNWLAHRLVSELSRRGDPSRWLFSSFSPSAVGIVKSLNPLFRTALLTFNCGPDEVAEAVHGGHAAIHPWEPQVDEAALRSAHTAGLAVNVWTCNDPGRMGELIGWGVDGICTDVPDVALAVRRGESVG